MIKIMLACPTLNRIDKLTEMLQSVAASTRQPDRVLLINNGHQIRDSHYEEWSRWFDLDVYTPQHNLGVAGSVNVALHMTPPGWHYLHSNDDVHLDPLCIESLAKTAETTPSPKFVVPEHAVGSAFTVFLSQGLVESVGYFDSVYYPGYCEDDAYGRRMNLAGIKRTYAEGAVYVHFTSSTLKAYTDEQMRAHHDHFRRNADEFKRMWGGPMSAPVYEIPYNGRFGHTLENRAQWAVYESPREEDAI